MRFFGLLFLFLICNFGTVANEPDLSMFDRSTQLDIEVECQYTKAKEGIIAYYNCLIDEGKKHNIEFGIHYPRPVHRQKAYRDLKVKKLLNSEKQANELLSLPMFPMMKKNEMQKVVSFLYESRW